MRTRVSKGQGSQKKEPANRSAARNNKHNPVSLFEDNRHESLQLRKLQLMAESSPHAENASRLQDIANAGTHSATRRMLLDASSGAPVQRQDAAEEEELQMKAGPGVLQKQGMEEEDLQMKAGPGVLQKQGMEEEELQMKAGPGVLQKQGMEEEELQMKARPGILQKQSMEEKEPLQGRFLPVHIKDNNTGMPDQLKAGVEHLSGMPLDDVKVHYNSAKPATLQALAYTQGADIHVGPGQEKHLPHEAWHVAQQKQGRVRPTMQMAGTQINDDSRLEKEADVMGTRALRGALLTAKAPRLLAGDHPSVQRMVIQRAVGMEFECSNLEIVEYPNGASKGDIIDQDTGRHWDMTFEETSEGTPVVEFVVEPAAEVKTELINAVSDMAREAAMLDNSTPTVIGNFKIKKAGKIEGAIQVTMGTPLANLPELFSEYRSITSSSPSKAYERYQKMIAGSDVTTQVTTTKTHKFLGIKKLTWTTTSTTDVTTRVYEQAPDGTEVRNLPDSMKGFLLLLMDYIVQGYVPTNYRGPGANIPFAKALYPLMARTDFKSIFKTLPTSEINRLSEINSITNDREMKGPWWKWIIKKALGNDSLTQDFLTNDQLINFTLTNKGQLGGDPKRSDFLKQLPTRDLLVAQNYLGLGKLGNKADVSATDPTKLAPIFELRKPYGSAASYTSWIEIGEETWANYLKIVKERMNRGGTVN